MSCSREGWRAIAGWPQLMGDLIWPFIKGTWRIDAQDMHLVFLLILMSFHKSICLLKEKTTPRFWTEAILRDKSKDGLWSCGLMSCYNGIYFPDTRGQKDPSKHWPWIWPEEQEILVDWIGCALKDFIRSWTYLWTSLCVYMYINIIKTSECQCIW